METLLITQDLSVAFKPITKKEEKDLSLSKFPEEAIEINKKVMRTIILSLSDSVIREIVKEKIMIEL